MAGLVLTGTVLFHLFRVFAVHGVGKMMPVPDDVRELLRDVRGAGHAGLTDAKYDAFQKGYHAAAALAVLVLVLSGLLMLAKIDTSLWRRDPSILSDQTWGIVYVAHGAASMALLFLFILHVYFAILPEHRAFLFSMLNGRGPENARKGIHD
jgi:cytochrome b subunit of formate dehydrogenase